MTQEKRLLDILLAITRISNNNKLEFEEKLQQILLEVVKCMQAKRGSIMLLKGRKALEVAASTNPELIGVKQELDKTSPSAWVVKNKTPLYVDKDTRDKSFHNNLKRYKKSAFLLVPIINNNKVIGVLNVTDRIAEDLFKEAEQEILLEIAGHVISALETQRLTKSLRKSRRTLEKKSLQLKKLEKLRTDLFNMLIHDLKGPISEVVANLDILTYTVDDENRQYVESAQIGCDTLQAMVFNLLDIARLEERKLKLIYEKIDPEDLIKEVLGRLLRVGKTRELQFAEKFPPSETKLHFLGDRGILLRVLQNLLSNAIQYSPSGETIEMGFEYLRSPKIRFFVADRGPGVAAEYQQAIFDKYMQIDKKADGRIYTTGMGLTFCKMAVQAHRGKIGVKAEAQKGSRFWFALPLDMK
jgi:two-component system sensor histidine kinase KdpD